MRETMKEYGRNEMRDCGKRPGFPLYPPPPPDSWHYHLAHGPRGWLRHPRTDPQPTGRHAPPLAPHRLPSDRLGKDRERARGAGDTRPGCRCSRVVAKSEKKKRQRSKMWRKRHSSAHHRFQSSSPVLLLPEPPRGNVSLPPTFASNTSRGPPSSTTFTASLVPAIAHASRIPQCSRAKRQRRRHDDTRGAHPTTARPNPASRIASHPSRVFRAAAPFLLLPPPPRPPPPFGHTTSPPPRAPTSDLPHTAPCSDAPQPARPPAAPYCISAIKSTQAPAIWIDASPPPAPRSPRGSTDRTAGTPRGRSAGPTVHMPGAPCPMHRPFTPKTHHHRHYRPTAPGCPRAAAEIPMLTPPVSQLGQMGETDRYETVSQRSTVRDCRAATSEATPRIDLVRRDRFPALPPISHTPSLHRCSQPRRPSLRANPNAPARKDRAKRAGRTAQSRLTAQQHGEGHGRSKLRTTADDQREREAGLHRGRLER